MRKLELYELELLEANGFDSWADGFCTGAAIAGVLVGATATGPGFLVTAGFITGACGAYVMRKYI